MNKRLYEFIASLGNADESRRKHLDSLVVYIKEKLKNQESINLNFICTHNSRRSHLAQIWAKVASSHYSILNVNCYSGGTEATAMYPSVKNTLIKQGLKIIELSTGNNPIYGIKYAKNKQPIIAFSKTYDHPFNPSSHFAAIMTCDHADQNCPFIHGAENRFAINYVDPKSFDNTELEAQKYIERSTQIAEEMFYVFKNI